MSFRSMSPAFSLLSSNKDGLSSKEKKYINGVEKLINTFDTSIIEWADHISFLSRLLKNLQLNPLTEVTKNYIPFDLEISKCLSMSLSKNLPSGVHKKALEVYNYIFEILGDKLSDSITVWLPGLLPLMSYASMGVKPQLIEIFAKYVLQLPKKTLNHILRPVLLSLLPSIDDETSDNFNDCLQLLDNLKAKLQNDHHFWSVIFLIIITSDDKRLGALIWCQRRLPFFDKKYDELDQEAQYCIGNDKALPVLLVLAISKGLIDENILIQRGFFDLLGSHLPLNSFVLQEWTKEEDLVNLIMNASYSVLRRDMSLNRRLWNWLLGPDDPTEAVDVSRSEYFAKFGFQYLSKGLLKCINGEKNTSAIDQRLDAFKISLLIMEKWEVGQLIVPKILTPIIVNSEKLADNDEVLRAANVFFDNVDCLNIWLNFLQLILAKDLKLCLFILQNFNVEEEEMVINHLPLMLLALLSDPVETDPSWIELVLTVSGLIPERAYLPIDHVNMELVSNLDGELILQKITNYYANEEPDENAPPAFPFQNSDLSFIILDLISHLILAKINQIYDEKLPTEGSILKLFQLLADVLDKVPQLDGHVYSNSQLAKAIYLINDHHNCLELTFGIGQVFNHIVRAEADVFKRLILLQNYLDQLWILLSSDLAIKYQVEIVKLIFSLEMSMPSEYVEGFMTKIFNNEEGIVEKLTKFNLLWTHSTKFQDLGLFLKKTVELIMDDLEVDSNGVYVKNWIMLMISNGNINRFIKILISPLMGYSFLKGESGVGKVQNPDDFTLFDYKIRNLISFINIDKKILDVLKTETIIIDNEQLVEVIKSNGWDNDLSYKSLILKICFKLIESPSSLASSSSSNHFINTLHLIKLLIDGSESDFKNYFKILSNLSIETDSDLLKIELLNLILHFLQISKTRSMVIFNEDEINDDNVLLNLILENLTKATDSNIIMPLVKLLSESLNVFKDYIFNIILKISNTILLKVNEFFTNFREYIESTESVTIIASDLDQSMSLLMTGLEELLSVSHSYLLAHQLDSGDASTIHNGDSGFFGSVIQGVFQMEHHPEFNVGLLTKKTAVLLSFKNSVNSVYKIWLWAEVNSKISLLANASKNDSNKSLTYMATKYKYRSKKFLEFLYVIEPSEIVESLISYNGEGSDHKLIFKILHILDGSRPNLTLPHLLNSITSRCGSSSADKINSEIDEKQFSRFLFSYFQSLDKNLYEDLYTIFNGFLKVIVLTVPPYKHIYPSIVKSIVLMDISLGSDSKKLKRELNEVFFKMLSILSTSKLAEDERVDFVDSLNYFIPYLKEMLFDSDKLNLIFNTIVSYIQPYLLKNDLNDTYIQRCVLLLNEETPLKSWKSLVNELTIGHGSFFSTIKSQDLGIHNQLVAKNFGNDQDKINDLLLKLAVNNSNFLNWNDYTEILNGKKLNLKKIIYLIACCPQNNYMNLVSELISKIKELIVDKDLKLEIYLLIRCLVLKFDDTYISNIWVLVYNELYKFFSNIVQELNQLDKLEKINLPVLFGACKLLDVLIYSKSEEFQLDEWLFIADSDDQESQDLFSLIDAIGRLEIKSEAVEGEVSKEEAGEVERDENGDSTEEENDQFPLLLELKTIDSLQQLQKIFFKKLSKANYNFILNYISNTGSSKIHRQLLEQDLFNDLFS